MRRNPLFEKFNVSRLIRNKVSIWADFYAVSVLAGRSIQSMIPEAANSSTAEKRFVITDSYEHKIPVPSVLPKSTQSKPSWNGKIFLSQP